MAAITVLLKRLATNPHKTFRSVSQYCSKHTAVTDERSCSISPISCMLWPKDFVQTSAVGGKTFKYNFQEKQLGYPSRMIDYDLDILKGYAKIITPAYQYEPDREISIRNPINEIDDVIEKMPIQEPKKEDIPLEAAKSDIKWRRRRMRRHRLLRWRKKYRNLVIQREKRKLAKRERLFEADLTKSWEMFGLKEEPPMLSEEEVEKYEKEWREEGIWDDALTVEEYKNFAKISSIRKATDRDRK